ncbi:hypothetical protein [Peribacillus simplex]|uniref:hypothetical protein n=1 Tax=Peribacillus simplex TaxID=1478 RepID=UPI0014855B05|nr:hypothetical protein [Peribacillus simplex]
MKVTVAVPAVPPVVQLVNAVARATEVETPFKVMVISPVTEAPAEIIKVSFLLLR